MQFVPKSDAELAEQNLIPQGVYQFEVLEAVEETSRAGNPQIKLKLKIWTHDGKERVIFDYILEAFAFKLKHFCDVTHMLDKYEQGNLQAHDCIFKMGQLELGIQKGKVIPDDKLNGKPRGTCYPDRNVVIDYTKEPMTAAPAQAQTTAKPADVEFDSDVPF